MQQIKLADIQMKMEKRKGRVVSLSWSVGFRFLSKRENSNVRLSDCLQILVSIGIVIMSVLVDVAPLHWGADFVAQPSI